MGNGYEDIDNLMSSQNNMLDESLNRQQEITNKQTQMSINELEKNKSEIENETKKTNRGLYTEYKKASNPYGTNAEQLYAKGLGNSGYAETTQTNLYNTYQKNITDTQNNAQKLKADFDFQINQARQNGDITLAQNALQIYNQKMQLLSQEYELRNNREQYLYQQQQDVLAQSNWEKEFAYQQQRNAEQLAYQKERDRVADEQWAKEYALSKAKTKSSTGGEIKLKNDDDGNNNVNEKESETVKKLYNSLSGFNTIKTNPIQQETARRLILGEQQKGTINDNEASYLFNEFGL